MSLISSLFYGLRILKMKRQKGDKVRPRMLISIISIGLSIIPVIVTIVVTNGMIEGITSRIMEFQSGHLQLGLDFEVETERVEDSMKDLHAVPDVKNTWLERQGLGLFFHDKNKMMVSVRAVPKNIYTEDEGFNKYVSLLDGQFDLEKKNSVVIGQALADEYSLSIGDSIRIYTFRGDFSNGTAKGARVNRLTVTGIYTVGYRELDKNVVFVSYEDGKIMLPFSNSKSTLFLKVTDPYQNLDSVSKQIEDVLSNHEIYGLLLTWQRINRNHYSAYETTKWMLIFIMMFIVVVAVLNIIISMIMVVLDRMKEIGILKSIGSGPGSIAFSFMFVGFCTGLSGIVLGVAAGLFISVNINEIIIGIDMVSNGIVSAFYSVGALFGGTPPEKSFHLLNPEYYLEHIPVRIEILEIALVCIITLVISVLVSLIPAEMARRTKPLEVIRKH